MSIQHFVQPEKIIYPFDNQNEIYSDSIEQKSFVLIHFEWILSFFFFSSISAISVILSHFIWYFILRGGVKCYSREEEWYVSACVANEQEYYIEKLVTQEIDISCYSF